MSKKKFIDELFCKRSEFKDHDQAETMSNLLDTISSDIYSESQRFVFELIQNADDAAKVTDNEVHFDFYENCLIISHNGQPFSEEDIKSLTSAGSSTKKADKTKTGYKGIGFKSVFGKSERVTIFSDGFQFRFDKSYFEKTLPWQIIPIWTELNELTKYIQEIVSKNTYSVSTIIEISNVESLQNDLNDLLNNGQILLFLRKVSKISVSKNNKPIYSIEKRILSNNSIFNEVSLLKKGKEISCWITKTFHNITVPNNTKEELKRDNKTPKKLKDAEFTEISFAAKIEEGKIKDLKERDSLIFTYLPTKVSNFKFPFLVNGSFLTNAAREGIHEDKVWNQWLFELIAERTLEWLESLATTKFKFQILQLLPNKFKNSTNELKKSFNNSFTKYFPEKSFIITTNESIKKPSEVVLDKTGLSLQKFIDPISITEFIEKKKQLKFSDDCFVNIKVEVSNKLKTIKVETFELENIVTFFISESFTKRHKVSENFDLIKYFKEKSDKDTKGLWFQSLKTFPFIFDEKGLLYKPPIICFPTGISSTELGDIPIIHPNVFVKIQKDKFLYNWFKRLGTKEASPVTYVTSVIIPNLDKSDSITASNFLEITHYLFRLFNEKLLDNEMLESLRELKIKTRNETLTFDKAQDCYLSNKYQPQLKIEEIIKEVSYVSEEYLSNDGRELEWNLFFKAIKVKDRVEVQTINQNNILNTLRKLTHKDWVDNSKAYATSTSTSTGGFGFGEHNVISSLKLPSFLNLISSNREYSKIFWENIISNSNNLSKLTANASYNYGVGYGENEFSCPIENYFPWFIKSQNCIPTTTKEILNAKNVFINNSEIKEIAGSYLPVFDYDEPLPDDWKFFLQLKDKLTLNDYLSILSRIVKKSEEEEEKMILKPQLRIIGQIFNKLSTMIPEMTEANKQVISDWATQNKLPCLNGNFEPVNQLKWITVEGFSTESDKLKIIHLPENFNKDLDLVKELILLLKIQIIEEFIPTFEELNSDFSLKNKLEEILPYYVALIQKKRMKDLNQEFERLYNLINVTEFYTASEIKLSFNHQSETFEGPSLRVFKEDNKFYFKGKWKSERTLLSLIKELSNLFDIVNLNEELRFLLLESEASEIKEYLNEQGIESSKIRQVKPFSKQILTAHEKKTPPCKNELTTGHRTFGKGASSYENFDPTSIPSVFDDSKISAKIKVFNDTIVKTNYTNIENQEIREDVGRWCEEIVYKYLLNNCTHVVWVNEETESGKPYDIKIVEDGVEKFIDVKGTPSSFKDLIYLSPNEWSFMFEKGQNYSIYRVYNAGKNPKIEIIENPSNLLQQGKISLNTITLQI